MVLPRPHFEQNLSFANQRERIYLPCTQRIMELKNLILFSVVFGAFVCFFVFKFLLAWKVQNYIRTSLSAYCLFLFSVKFFFIRLGRQSGSFDGRSSKTDPQPPKRIFNSEDSCGDSSIIIFDVNLQFAMLYFDRMLRSRYNLVLRAFPQERRRPSKG